MFQLIKNANVFSPTALGLCNILIVGESIAYIGKDVPVLDSHVDVQFVDADGASVIPGFIDAHAHITGGGVETGPNSRVPPCLLIAIHLGWRDQCDLGAWY